MVSNTAVTIAFVTAWSPGNDGIIQILSGRNRPACNKNPVRASQFSPLSPYGSNSTAVPKHTTRHSKCNIFMYNVPKTYAGKRMYMSPSHKNQRVQHTKRNDDDDKPIIS